MEIMTGLCIAMIAKVREPPWRTCSRTSGGERTDGLIGGASQTIR